MQFSVSPDEVIEYYRDELTDAEIYKALANVEKDPRLKEELIKLSNYETQHAKFWSEVARAMNLDVSNIKPSKFMVSYSVVIRRLLGLGFLVKLRESAEVEAIRRYGEAVRRRALGPLTDRLREILLDEVAHEEVFREVGSRFEGLIENIRDAMYGMSDGLVEVLAAVAGLAPVVVNPILITLAGLIVGAAGTLSMAVGAYMSTKAQQDIRETKLSKLDIELENLDVEDRSRRVKNALVSMGLNEGEAQEVASMISTDLNVSKKITAAGEIGYLEEALESPGRSALYTGIFYLIGALLVIAPFPLLGHLIGNVYSLFISIILVAIAQGISGLITAISGSGKVMRTIALNIALSLGAAGATYALGTAAHTLFGLSIT
ncbi:VIT1/CCC1 transporter family protein [Vulcanisaeta thermophila]|uniref:VIT1/CCC1 transporter family protein n=1 Tax=Vulcanisaeta thermophila TaxID=867917 RepID=UPI00085357F0|nr:VIT1/CCC1 transporter family protein [Vulcanisaeta thermophila]